MIAANHASFLDGLLLGAFLPGEPIFAVDTLDRAEVVGAAVPGALVNALPVDPTNPLSIRAMIRAVEAGSACVIFPEGRITTTGALMKVYEGPAVIADAPTRRSCRCASRAPSSRRSRASAARSGSAGSRRSASASCRRAVSRARRRDRPRAPGRAAPRARPTRWCRSMFATAPIDTTLFDALLDARHIHGGGHVDRRRPRVAAA